MGRQRQPGGSVGASSPLGGASRSARRRPLALGIFVSPAYHVPEQSAEEKFAEQCFLAGLDPQACCVDPSGAPVACTCGGANAPPQESVCPEVGGRSVHRNRSGSGWLMAERDTRAQGLGLLLGLTGVTWLQLAWSR